jgi:KDO2-lipid IV(A) lauroyltransferase
VRLLAGAFGFLPLDIASGLGGGIARLLGPHLGITNVARENLRQAFADLPEEEISQIVKAMWDNLGRVAGEYPHLKKIRVFATGGRVETHGFEHVDRAVAAGRRMIIFSGHLANWEIGALAALQYGISVVQIYRAANNPLVDRMVLEFRGKPDGFAAKGSAGARRALIALRQGVHLSLLADQKMNDGIAVPFFGRKAMTAPALAALALRFDCDVLPARVERLSGARFRLTVHPPLPHPRNGSREADIAQLMAAVNAKLEEWIRERPAEWLWLHRRWGS